MYVNAIKSICQIFALVWLVQNSIIQCHFTALQRLVHWLIFKWWIKSEMASLIRIQASECLPWVIALRSSFADLFSSQVSREIMIGLLT